MKTDAIKIFPIRPRGFCNWIAVVALLALPLTISVRAGTITVVPLPGTNTDLATGITTNKTYVSCVDYGNRNNTIYSVNGVPFAHPDFSFANNTVYATNFFDPASAVWATGGQILGGYVFLSTITNSAGNIGHIDQASSAPPGTPGPQADGNTLNLLYDQIYPGNGQTAGDWVQEVYSNLVAGHNYSLRIFWRVQTVNNTNRLVDFWFNGEGTPQGAPGNPISLDTNVITHFSGAEYIEYDFAASGTTVSMLMTNVIGGQGSTTFFATLEDDSYPYAPFITYEPQPVGLTNGGFEFTSAAIGTAALSYQWYVNTVSNYSGSTMLTDGNGYSGSASNNLITTTNFLDYYYVVVTNNYGAITSSIAQINPVPSFLSQPSPVVVTNSVQFTAVATGIPPLTYQWYVNTTSNYSGATMLSDGNGYSGSATNTLITTTNLQEYYFAIVTNAYGSATSSIAAYNPYPAISSQPVSFKSGTSVGFTVGATGWPTLYYQWYYNTVSNTSGATPLTDGGGVSGSQTASATVTNLIDYYFVVVSNYYGTATSSVVVTPPLTVVSVGEPIWNQVSQTNVIVVFSYQLDPTTALTATNYSLNNGANVVSAALGGSNEVVLTTSALSSATTYTLTVQSVKDYFGVVMSPSPTNLTVGVFPANLALWVRANTNVTTDAGTNTVNAWNDLTVNGNNLSQGLGAPYEPVLDTNAWGDPVITFNATNETFMEAGTSSSLAITGDISIIAVMNFASLIPNTNGEVVSKTGAGSAANIPAPYDYYVTSTGAHLYRGNGSSYGQVSASSTPSAGAPHILAVSESGNTVTHYLDGAAAGSGVLNNNFNESSCTDAGQPLSIGIRGDAVNRLTGDVAELIIAGSSISSYDVTALANYLAVEHNISLVNLTPTDIGFSLSSGQLNLSWPSDHTGWQLQAQTNAPGVGIGTNWVNVAGSTSTNQVAIPVNPGNGSVFYRLVYP
jgi:hypothetical protein